MAAREEEGDTPKMEARILSLSHRTGRTLNLCRREVLGDKGRGTFVPSVCLCEHFFLSFSSKYIVCSLGVRFVF